MPKTPPPSSTRSPAAAIEFNSPQAKDSALAALRVLDETLLTLRTNGGVPSELTPALDNALLAASSIHQLLFPTLPSLGRILLIDGHRLRVGEWQETLQAAGYDVKPVEDQIGALQHILGWRPDLVVVNWTLLQNDSTLIARLRSVSQAFIVILAGRGILRRGHGLLEEADDLFLDTLGSEGLVERVRGVLQRNGQSGTRIMLGPLFIDLVNRTVSLAGRPVELTPTEYRLLYALASQGGRVLTHEHLLKLVWGPEYTDSNDYLWVHLSRLRRKLKLNNHPDLIVTERGIGYRLHVG